MPSVYSEHFDGVKRVINIPDAEDGAAIKKVQQQLLTKSQIDEKPSSQGVCQDYAMSEDNT